MGLLTSTWYWDAVLLVATIIAGVILYFKRSYQYWKKLGVPEPWPAQIPLGHFKGMSTEHSAILLASKFYEAAPNEKIIGVYSFSSPILIVRDLDIAKDILVKEFGNFHDRGLEINAKAEPLAGHLFLMKGQEWRNVRIKLTPTFTSGKMKMMYPTILDVGKQLEEVLFQSTELPEVDIKDIMARFTTDVIASCAFGIEANSLKNPQTEFRIYGKELSTPELRRMILNVLFFTSPKLMKYLPVKFFPEHISKFFLGVVEDTMKYREENNTQRNDFMQLLIQLKTLGYVKDADSPESGEDKIAQEQKFTLEQAAAQAFLFFFAGFETASSTMQFALYELALNPELQAKVQAEIDYFKAKRGDESISYEALHEMGLLDRTISETLRKYSVGGVVIRQSNKEYKVPGTSVTLPAGTRIWLPTFGYQRDEKYYPDPEKFDPDRFLPEVKAQRHHYAYLPFGEGPRNCIGNRFGLLQCKIGLAVLLSNFSVSPSKGTPIPLEFDPKSDLVLAPKGNLYLKLTRRAINCA